MKEPLFDDTPRQEGPLRLIPCESEWVRGESLQTVVYARCHSRRLALAEIFEPCKGWLDLLRERSSRREGDSYLDGELVDCVWSNVYACPEGYFITDHEWVWEAEIRFNVLVVRAIYTFLCQFDAPAQWPAKLRVRSGRRAIRLVAKAIGIHVTRRDFADFVALESQLQSLVFGYDRHRVSVFIQWFLIDRGTLESFRSARRLGSKVAAAVQNRWRR